MMIDIERLIIEFLWPKLKNIDGGIWFQQFGDTIVLANDKIDLSRQTFPG